MISPDDDEPLPVEAEIVSDEFDPDDSGIDLHAEYQNLVAMQEDLDIEGFELSFNDYLTELTLDQLTEML